MKSPPSQPTARKLYDLPRYYDAAFAGDPAHEAMIVERAICEYSPHPVRRILEPACGSGRLLIAMALYGYHLTGYDRSASMVRFARQRIDTLGMARHIHVVRADMTTAIFRGPKHDAAFNLISSIAHLLTDDALIAHLHHTAASLIPGAIYIVELPPLFRPGSVPLPNHWQSQTGKLRIDTTWHVIRDDVPSRLSHQRCTMRIRDGSKRITHTENISVRLFLPGDWRKLVTLSGCFDRVALIRSAGRSFHILRRL